MTKVLSTLKPYDLVSKHEKKIDLKSYTIIFTRKSISLKAHLQPEDCWEIYLTMTQFPRMAPSYWQHSKTLVEKNKCFDIGTDPYLKFPWRILLLLFCYSAAPELFKLFHWKSEANP